MQKLAEIEEESTLIECKLHLLAVQNNKLKSQYIKNEKKNNKLDHKVHKLQAAVLQIVGSSEASEPVEADQPKGNHRLSFEDMPAASMKRKCRSYHGSPEKLKWRQENEEALEEAKSVLERELRDLKIEHQKLIEMESYLKKKSLMAAE